jgi:hypothetical protein
MFGRRSGVDEARLEHPVVVELPRSVQRNLAPLNTKPPAVVAVAPNPHQTRKTDEYYDLKKQVFGALIEIIDVSQLAQMDLYQARRNSARSSTRSSLPRRLLYRPPSRKNCSKTSATTSLGTARWSPSSPATTSPTSW